MTWYSAYLQDYVSALPSYYCDLRTSIYVPNWDRQSYSYWSSTVYNWSCWNSPIHLFTQTTNGLIYSKYCVKQIFSHQIFNIYLWKWIKNFFRSKKFNFSTQVSFKCVNETHSFYERNENALYIWHFLIVRANFTEHTIKKSALPQTNWKFTEVKSQFVIKTNQILKFFH